MSMDNIKRALTRKIGPFAAWIWFAIAGGLLWYYRQRTAANSSDAAQAAAADSAPAYYGPYGQDNYPITGGAYTGQSGAPSQDTQPTSPPTINVNVPGGKSEQRTPKSKKQHKTKNEKVASQHGNKRSNVTTHEGRKHPPTSTKNTRKFHGGPVRLRNVNSTPAKPAARSTPAKPAAPKPTRTRKRR